jgi:5'-nucleotidase
MLAAVVLPGCGDPGHDGGTAGTLAPGPSTTAPGNACTGRGTEPLGVVLVNDDGVTNPAIDVLIDRLSGEDALALVVTVVAPAGERSGSSDRTTPGGARHAETRTPGGNRAHAVEGFPADAVLVALDDLGLRPHLVVSGINPGQNFGTNAPLSGTIGAARTAVRRGVPALAVSGGLAFDRAQFEVGADLAARWIREHCEALVARRHPIDTLTSINLPACPPERMGPLKSVPRALAMPALPDGGNIFVSRCDQADPAPANDVLAVVAGYPSLTQIGPDI